MQKKVFTWCTEVKTLNYPTKGRKMVLPDDQRQNSNYKIKGKEQDASHSRHQNWYDSDH